MREHSIYQMSGVIGVFLASGLISSLSEGTIDKTVFGIHDSCLRVVACLFLNTC